MVRWTVFALLLPCCFCVLIHEEDVGARPLHPDRSEFHNFMETHERSYAHGSDEYHARFETFQKSLSFVREQNSKPNRLWTAEINMLSDLTPKEIKDRWQGWKGGIAVDSPMGLGSFLQQFERTGKRQEPSPPPLPKDVSWQHLQTSSPSFIRSQGCGNCWAASTSSMMEAHSELQGINRTFSMKELTECTPNPFSCGGDGGCAGATSEVALQYAMMNGLGPRPADELPPPPPKAEAAEEDSVMENQDPASDYQWTQKGVARVELDGYADVMGWPQASTPISQRQLQQIQTRYEVENLLDHHFIAPRGAEEESFIGEDGWEVSLLEEDADWQFPSDMRKAEEEANQDSPDTEGEADFFADSRKPDNGGNPKLADAAKNKVDVKKPKVKAGDMPGDFAKKGLKKGPKKELKQTLKKASGDSDKPKPKKGPKPEPRRARAGAGGGGGGDAGRGKGAAPEVCMGKKECEMLAGKGACEEKTKGDIEGEAPKTCWVAKAAGMKPPTNELPKQAKKKPKAPEDAQQEFEDKMKENQCSGARAFKDVVGPLGSGPHEWGDGLRKAEAEDSGPEKIKLVGWERLPSNKYEPLMRAVAEKGPVAVAVATDWHPIASGIYDGCPKDAIIGHSVLLIGYGHDEELNTSYWLIQNSWGQKWGNNGTFRLKRDEADEEEYCGQDSQPELGTGCKDGPKSVEICGRCGILYDTVLPVFEVNKTDDKDDDKSESKSGSDDKSESSSGSDDKSPSASGPKPPQGDQKSDENKDKDEGKKGDKEQQNAPEGAKPDDKPQPDAGAEPAPEAAQGGAEPAAAEEAPASD